MAIPDLIICGNCDRHLVTDEDPTPFPTQNDAYYCPQCGEDESGLNFYYNALRSDIAIIPPPDPVQVARSLYLANRQQIVTNPNFNEYVDACVSEVRRVLFEENEMLEAQLEDLTLAVFAPVLSDEQLEDGRIQVELKSQVQMLCLRKLWPMLKHLCLRGE